jgi:predicted transcriptional regulator
MNTLCVDVHLTLAYGVLKELHGCSFLQLHVGSNTKAVLSNFEWVFAIADAAVLMLKNKIHRIPIVNEKNQVVGKISNLCISLYLLKADCLRIFFRLLSGIPLGGIVVVTRIRRSL